MSNTANEKVITDAEIMIRLTQELDRLNDVAKTAWLLYNKASEAHKDAIKNVETTLALENAAKKTFTEAELIATHAQKIFETITKKSN